MKDVLFELEEKIKSFLGKEGNKDKSFDLLYIARRLDPRNKISYVDFETVLRKLELEGVIYQNDDGTWCEFPTDEEIFQGIVRKNEKGSTFVELKNGLRFIFNEKDAGYLLDGDNVIFSPTKVKSGSRIICDLKKVLKRRNGLVIVKYQESLNHHCLVPISSKLKHPILLPEEDTKDLKDNDYLLVQIDDINNDGAFEAKLMMKFDSEKEALHQSVSKIGILSKENYDSNYYLENYIDNSQNKALENDYESFLKKGVLKINHYGEGTVEVDNKQYRIKRENLGDALNGDTVEIRPSKLKIRGKTNAMVENVVERKDGLVVVEVDVNSDNEIKLILVNSNFKHELVLPEGFSKPLVVGDRMLVRIDSSPKNGVYPIEFVKYLGHKDDPDIKLKTIIANYGIKEEFSEEEMKEANSLPTSVSEEEKKGRVDYTKKKVFSIDGATTKDRDDAVSIERLENGNFSVGVHISDVTHYIKPGMALWNAIMSRATSVYLLDKVIPMLPHIISNGICSLNPGVDRLTLSCIMEITPNGDVVSYDFKDVVINSKKAMVYDEVNEILEEDNVPEGYEDFVTELKDLNYISQKLTMKSALRGAIDFGDVQIDTKVEYDENGEPVNFVSVSHRSAEKIIENLMLLTGVCYADYMTIPTTYRVHEQPDERSLKEAVQKIKKLGGKVKNIRNIVNGNVLNKIIRSIKDTDVRTAASNIILTALKRARIDVDGKIGHYALAFAKIGRFTSPIRRAEDVIAHFQLRKQRDALYKEDFDIEVKKDYDWINKEAKYITLKQVNADLAEKEAVYEEMVQYINKRIGEQFAATVVNINEDGIFVKTENGVLGKIDPYDFEGEILVYDDRRISYFGRTTGHRIKIGSKLIVTALDTTREYNTINFGVIRDPYKGKTLKKVA